MELTNRRILLGITGGIAAFKCADLVRRLRERGAEIRVVITPGASAFITPLTLQAVSGHPVAESLLDPAAEAAMGHIELARWADLVLIAPASANFLARLTAGFGSDLLSTLCLATASPIAIAPAMNQQMWQAPATTENLATLARRGTLIWGPAEGSQACGEVGPGRMLEPLELVDHCISHFSTDGPLRGKKVMITAGPTREPLDPVRFLTNHSSGKMGFALARAARKLGADVELVCGPVSLPTPPGCQRIDVETAGDMHQAVMSRVDACDLFIACAAVADYRPRQIAGHKIKKQADEMTIELVKNPDIVADVAAKSNKPFTIGFAAETRDVATYAQQKLERKGLDMIAANDVSGDQQGFNTDTNALLVLWSGGQQRIPLADKQTVAEALLSLAAERYRSMNESD